MQFSQRWHVRTYEVDENGQRADEVELTVRVLGIGGVRGRRHTEIRRTADSALLAEVTSEWVWVSLADGRPTRVPAELVTAFSPDVRA
ncbi:hypothetical protein BH24CHL10_BH24CHL10_11500 [soil metagenome]